MLFGKKEREVEELIAAHFSKVKECLDEFSETMNDYMKKDKAFKENAYKVDRLEHEADEIRREAEMKLCAGAFLPVYREDYVKLMEMLDEIADNVESATDFIALTRPKIPDFLQEGLRNMAEVTVQMFEPLQQMYEMFLEDISKVLEIARTVRDKEQAVDNIEWHVIRRVFKSDLPLAEKMLLKELVDYIGNISDQIEDVSDRFAIMVIKRSM